MIDLKEAQANAEQVLSGTTHDSELRFAAQQNARAVLDLIKGFTEAQIASQQASDQALAQSNAERNAAIAELDAMKSEWASMVDGVANEAVAQSNKRAADAEAATKEVQAQLDALRQQMNGVRSIATEAVPVLSAIGADPLANALAGVAAGGN